MPQRMQYVQNAMKGGKKMEEEIRDQIEMMLESESKTELMGKLEFLRGWMLLEMRDNLYEAWKKEKNDNKKK